MTRLHSTLLIVAIGLLNVATAAPSLAYPYNYSGYYGGGYNPAMYNGGMSTFVSPYTQSIDAHKANIQMRLNQLLPSGRVNPMEAQKLMRDLNNINVKEMTYLNNSRGSLSTFQRLRLEGELDGLDARLTHDTYPSW